MLIINRKEGESIERMLRKYKRKHRDTKIRQELRQRKEFLKPSVKRRKEILKAKYILKKESNN